MKFSIIVPIYNVEAYLCECIESVLKQSYTNFDLILVDDGSSDDSAVICDDYAEKDSRVKVIHKSNGGLVSARKAGLEVATGNYVVCLDGDDLLRFDCLKMIYDKLSKYPDIDVLSFGLCLYWGDRVIEKPIDGYRYGYYNYNQLEKELFPKLIYSSSSRKFPHTICGKAIKMELYRKYQMKVSSDISMGEDRACMHPLLANIQSLYVLKDCLYYYRQIDTSMTKVKKPLLWDSYDKIFVLYNQEMELEKYDLCFQIYRLRTHNLFNVVMSQFYSKRPYKQITSDILKRFEEHPEYDVAINNSNFDSIVLKLIRLLLKYRCFRILFLYAQNRSLLKNFKHKLMEYQIRYLK